MVSVKQNSHDALLRRVISDNLLRRLTIDEIPEGLIPTRHWTGYHFTIFGIKHDTIYRLEDAITSPDLIALSEKNPIYRLLFIEIKTSRSADHLKKMEQQVNDYYDYVYENPEYLLDFLNGEDVDESIIDRLVIGFLGVRGTKYGIRCLMYREL